VRCPANISFLAITLLSLCIQPTYRWVKYAGNWNPTGPESWSYTLQRWWLRKGLHRGIVTINGRWPDQPSHTYSFLNPSLTSQEICQAAELREPKEISRPLRLLFVGRIETPKGVGRIMRIAQALKERHIDYHLDLLGDGPERPDFEKLTQDNGLNSRVTFHGWLPRPELGEFYQKAHFFIFPSSSSEGWPKVLSEAMAYGVVPLAGAVSSIPQILSETGAGIALPPYDIDAFVKTIESMLKDPGQWKAASKAGINAAYQFTYEYYLETVKKTFHCAWGMVI
jgi:glycosyltransferase involved in cell wall biosynthesis